MASCPKLRGCCPLASLFAHPPLRAESSVGLSPHVPASQSAGATQTAGKRDHWDRLGCRQMPISPCCPPPPPLARCSARKGRPCCPLAWAHSSEPPAAWLLILSWLNLPECHPPPAQQCQRGFRLLCTQLVLEERKLPCKHGPGHHGNGDQLLSEGVTGRFMEG